MWRALYHVLALGVEVGGVPLLVAEVAGDAVENPAARSVHGRDEAGDGRCFFFDNCMQWVEKTGN